jgi:hypothetical protein
MISGRPTMKAAIAITMTIVSSTFSCTPKTKSEKRTELKPFFQNSVILKDTSLIRNLVKTDGDRSIGSYNHSKEADLFFLNEREFAKLTKSVLNLARNPQSFVYFNTIDKPAAKEKTLARLIECDSVVVSDENGKPTGNNFWACDSISIPNLLCRIDFFETWYLTENNIIEKEVIGYQLWFKNYEETWFRPLFFVFKDERSKNKYNSYFGI